MITVWRIVRSKYQHTLFTGEGARRYGNRWNSIGTPVVYTSESLALALLEKMVHLKDYEQLLDAFVAVRAAFDDQLVRKLEVFRHARRHHRQQLSKPPPEADPDSPWTLQINETDITTTIYGDWKAVSSRSKT